MTTFNHPKTVFVGLSGGVDSSVAALRLINSGYNVVGVFIKVWQPDFLKCNWEDERLDAMRVAAHLKIPFLTCDAEVEYKNEVGDYFIKEYGKGRTPNPDVMCNRFVKFGAFWRFAKENGADLIATGHYAQVRESGGEYGLYRGKDTNKDQSYFLWTLTQEDLSHTLFPVGDSDKEDIRKEAEQAKLPTAIKKDSQGICFLGQVDIKEFLGHFLQLVPGKVMDVHGEVIGEHESSILYTLGQRHGFTIFGRDVGGPHYVVAKDSATNTIVVDKNPPSLHNEKDIKLSSVNWISGELSSTETETQFRYRQTPFPVSLTNENGQLTLNAKNSIEKPSAGQSCVFYAEDKCLGGAVIE